MSPGRWSKGRASRNIHELLAAAGLHPVDLPTTDPESLKPTLDIVTSNSSKESRSDSQEATNAPRLRPRVQSAIERRDLSKRSGIYYAYNKGGSLGSLNGTPSVMQFETGRHEDDNLMKLVAELPHPPPTGTTANIETMGRMKQILDPRKLGRHHEALESHPLRFDKELDKETSRDDDDDDKHHDEKQHPPQQQQHTTATLPSSTGSGALLPLAQTTHEQQAQMQVSDTDSGTSNIRISTSPSFGSSVIREGNYYLAVSEKQGVQVLSSQDSGGGGGDGGADVPRRWKMRRHLHTKQGKELARMTKAYVGRRASPLRALIAGTITATGKEGDQ